MIEDIYGFEVSESMVTSVTNKILPQIEEWQNRPLSAAYPIVFIDAIHFSVRDEHIVKKIAAYIILGINDEGKKEVLSITIGENESSKYWLGVLNDLKKRGVQDILILCAWAYRHKGKHSGGISPNGISELRRSSCKKCFKACS